MAFLKVIVGPNSGQTCRLTASECVLGRHPGCDFPIDDEAASRRHARIVLAGSDHYLEDLDSRNGTFLNGERIQQRREIADGDRLRIGKTVFTFHLRPSSPASEGHPLIRGKGSLLLVDDEELEGDRALLSKRGASSGQATMPSNITLQAQLKALLEITHNLRKTLSLDSVLPQILESLFVIFPAAERGFIVLESDAGEITPFCVKLRCGDADDPVRISRTVIRQVMGAREGILSADAADDSRFESSKSLSEVRIRSMMCAPLIDTGGRSFGAIQIDTLSNCDRFQEEDLDVLLSVATQASIAIENARFHEYTLRQRTIQRDLDLADRIQRSFLPKRRPDLAGYEFFDHYRPASHVGGDFYDYVTLADGRLAVVVADVIGHGLAAAMLTAKLAAEVRFQLLSTTQPAEAVTQLNASLARDLMEGHFVTLVVAVLTPGTGEVTVVNAGHLRPILRRGDGRVSDVGNEQAGLPLGVLEERRYEHSTVRLSSGELLLIFTDGVNEAMNEAKELYGVYRISEHLRKATGGPVELGRNLLTDVERFLAGCPPKDDMCLVCFGKTDG